MSRPAAGLGVAIATLLAATLLLDQTRLDLSSGRTFTLAPQTQALLDRLDRDVTITLFFARDQPGFTDVADLADRFADASNRVNVHSEDPNGPRALELRIASGAVVAQAAGRPPEVIRIPDEPDLTQTVAKAAALPTRRIDANTKPSQPLFPTTLGRALMLWLPVIAMPTLLAAAGLAIALWRRQTTR